MACGVKLGREPGGDRGVDRSRGTIAGGTALGGHASGAIGAGAERGAGGHCALRVTGGDGLSIIPVIPCARARVITRQTLRSGYTRHHAQYLPVAAAASGICAGTAPTEVKLETV